MTKCHFIQDGKPPKENRDCKACPILVKNVAVVYDMQGKIADKLDKLQVSLNGTEDNPGWMTRTRILEERVAVLEERITNVKEGIIFRFENVEKSVSAMTEALDEMKHDLKVLLEAIPIKLEK